MNEYDIITLTPDMNSEWGKLLMKLRQAGEDMLYAVCSTHVDVEYLHDSINIYLADENFYNLLKSNLKKLEKIVGPDILNILLKTSGSQKNNPKSGKLKELFNGKIDII